MQQGLVEPRNEGTPQGGPLSPRLSNSEAGPATSAWQKRETYLKTSTNGHGASSSPWDWIGDAPGTVPSMAVARGGVRVPPT